MTAKAAESTTETTNAPVPDIDVILLPTPETLEIDGIPAKVNRLKSREFLTLIRVMTKGLGPGIRDVRFTGSEEEMGVQMTALLILAIPSAIDEFGQFLLSVVDAKDPSDRGRLHDAMVNPDIEVLLNVITILVEQEKDDFASLVGKARAALAKIQGLYSKSG